MCVHTKVWGIRVEEVGATVATSLFKDDDYEYDDPMAHREDDLEAALTSLAKVNIDDLQGINFETGQEEPDGNAGDPNHVHDHTQNYNVRELINGGADETNDIGRRNFFISAGHDEIDPETGKPRRDLSYYLMSLDLMNDKARRMAELEAEIKALEEQKAKLEDRLESLDAAEDLLDDEDLNDDTAQGRQKREKLKAELRRLGYDTDEFTNPDGTIDVQAARDALEEDRRRTEETLEQVETRLDAAQEEHAAHARDLEAAGHDPAAAARLQALSSEGEAGRATVVASLKETNGLSHEEQVEAVRRAIVGEDGSTLSEAEVSAVLETPLDDKSAPFGGGLLQQAGLNAGPPPFMRGVVTTPPVIMAGADSAEMPVTDGADVQVPLLLSEAEGGSAGPDFTSEAPAVVLASFDRSEGSFAAEEFGADDSVAQIKPIAPAFAAVTSGAPTTEQPVVVAQADTEMDKTADRVYTAGGNGMGVA